MYKLLSRSLFALLLGTAPLVLSASPAQAQVYARIQIAPPVPRVEIVPAAPSPRHVWIPGHWDWNGQRHIWVAGYHDLPPHRGYHWAPAHWNNEGGGWAFRQGHWTPSYQEQAVVAPPQEEYVVQNAPPPPVEEVVPPSPGQGQVWIPGYHRWDPMTRRHVWMQGHYRMGEPGRSWTPAHWQRSWRGWEFRHGHWR